MTPNRSHAFWIAVGLQILLLGGMYAQKAYLATQDKDLYLSIQATNTMVTGNTLKLHYHIQQIPGYYVDPTLKGSLGKVDLFSSVYEPPLKVGDTVYVPVSRTGSSWHLSRYVRKTTPPDSEIAAPPGSQRCSGSRCYDEYGMRLSSPTVWLKGIVQNYDSPFAPQDSYTASGYGRNPQDVESFDQSITYNVSYPDLETYTLHTSAKLPDTKHINNMLAHIKVDKEGKARVVGIIVNEKPWP
jgi:hypothetical protein